MKPRPTSPRASPRATRPKRKPANDNKKRQRIVEVQPASSRYMLGIAGVGLLAALVAITTSDPSPSGVSIADLPMP